MMIRLNDNWLTDGIIDFEYKKYVLLAYLQSVNKNFSSHKLYPFLGDLVRHYKNLQTFMNNKQATMEAFPRELKGIDLQNFVMKYEQAVEDDELMKEIEKIIDFSLPNMKRYLEEGREIYDWIEQALALQPVGIMPLEHKMGYLFIRNGKEKDTKVYRYKMSLIQTTGENFRSLHTNFLSAYTTSITHTYEVIKRKVIEKERLLTAPAVYLVESEIKIPFSETLLPIARRVLMSHLTKMENGF